MKIKMTTQSGTKLFVNKWGALVSYESAAVDLGQKGEVEQWAKYFAKIYPSFKIEII